MHQLHPRHSRVADRLDANDIEQRILRTYVQLAVTPERADGSRCATLARLGTLEVRLTECSHPARALPAEPPFWLEIYSHVMGSTVDRWGCFEFDETELATATELICEVCAGLERELPSSHRGRTGKAAPIGPVANPLSELGCVTPVIASTAPLTN